MLDLPPRGRYALKASRAIDVRAGRMIEPVVILVDDDRIEGIGPRLKIPDRARSVDLGSLTLLPGLHDNHCHLMLDPKNFDTLLYKRSSAGKVLDALVNAQRALAAGFTTVRDPGDCDWQYGLVDLKRAVDRGQFPGPRIIVAPHFISPTGGHGDANDFACDLHQRGIGRIVDGSPAIRQAVREEIKYGADWVKIFVSGGVLSKGDNPAHSTYTRDEVHSAAEEAHRLGKKITAHAHGAQAIRFCVDAGFDSVEHCTMVDDATIALMKKRGTYCVPTLHVLDFLVSDRNGLDLTPDIVAKAKEMRRVQRVRFRKIARAGVRVAYGTDIGVFPHGENWRDFPLLVECGMRPLEAIRSATINSARMNGIDQEVGTLESGKLADIIGVEGNPLTDIVSLSAVSFVMRAGRIFVTPIKR